MNKNNTVVNGDDMKIPTKKLRYDRNMGGLVDQPKSEPFLKGPIPISWINRAAQLPGKAINTALAIYWLRGMNADGLIKLNQKALEFFYVSADAALDALHRMETVGLIKLHKNPGQRHWIEVLPVSKKI